MKKILILLLILNLAQISNAQYKDNKTTIALITDADKLPFGVNFNMPIKDYEVGWFMEFQFRSKINNRILSRELFTVGLSYDVNEIITVYTGIGIMTSKYYDNNILSETNDKLSSSFGVIFNNESSIPILFEYNTITKNMGIGIGYCF